MQTNRLPKIFTSPKGLFLSPNLTRPDFGSVAYPRLDGQYNVQLVLSPEKSDMLLKKIAPEIAAARLAGDDAFARLPKKIREKVGATHWKAPWEDAYASPTSDAPTGDVMFRFATAASGTGPGGGKWTRKIPIFDAKGNLAQDIPDIGSGSQGAVRFICKPYFIPITGACGLYLYLEEVQVTDLVCQEIPIAAERCGFAPDASGTFIANPEHTELLG